MAAIYCLTASALEITIPDSLKGKVAISIIDLDNDKPVYNYNAKEPMLLASNMKVVTSYVALQKLGWDFHWQTKLAYTGNITDSQLNGDLYIIGGGDPFLSATSLNKMLQALNDSGINKINGDVILDNSIFNHPVHSSELKPEPYAPYSVNPNGLLIDNNLFLIPAKITQNKIKLVKPAEIKIKLINKLQYQKSKARCDDINDYVTITKTAKNTLTLSGTISQQCNNKKIGINLLSSSEFDKKTISTLLKKNDIAFTKIESGIAPSTLTVIATHDSESINTLLPIMNQMSNNTYAKTLFMSMGAYKTTNDNTYTDSKQYYKTALSEKFDFPELTPENGAGLSRHEKLTSEHMVDLLTAIYHSPDYAKFRLSLPTPSESGTIGNDYRQFSRQLYAKTGTLNDVKAYSGYFLSSNEHNYAISIIANNIKTNGTTPELNDFKQLFNTILTKLNCAN